MSGRLISSFLALATSIFISNAYCSMTVDQEFFSPEICDHGQVDSKYQTSNLSGVSLIECAVGCHRENNCYSFTYGPDCVYHAGIITSDCSTAINRTEPFYFEKASCLNGGTEQPDGTCYCQDGFIGDRCHRLMTDCSEGANFPYYANLNLALYAKPVIATQPILVRCTMQYGGRTDVLQHLLPATNFTRSWAEYKNGFGEGEMFIGLEKLYLLLNSRTMDLHFAVYNIDSLYYHQTYYNFRIGNESEDYMIKNIGSFGGPLGNCLSDLIGFSFATFDHGDANGRNCADSFTAGFWFREYCAKCNPFGQLVRPADGFRLNVSNEKFWPDVNFSPWRVKAWIE
ncbi:hypothetical protein SNE40_012566 [Patella caerulea]|uniref:Fibrinogen C-terminal domain-containing protein n=1 Tax=Patella caerulea TaxID=87958 RepID=A0AAN8PN36_PATCE